MHARCSPFPPSSCVLKQGYRNKVDASDLVYLDLQREKKKNKQGDALQTMP